MTAAEHPDDELRPRRWWPRRADRDQPDTPGADIVPLHPDMDGEVVAQDPGDGEPDGAPSERIRALVARWERPLPSTRQVRAYARWWTVHGGKACGSLLVRLPVLALAELKPIGRGVGRVAAGWADWMECTAQAARIAADDAKGSAKTGEHLEAMKSGRRKLSLAVAVILAGAVWWLVAVHPTWALAAGIVAVAALDAIGHRGLQRPVTEPLFVLPSVLAEGVPLSKVTATILETFDREGFEEGSVTVAAPLVWDQQRSEYRMSISSPDAIEPRHLRAIERAVGAGDHTVRLLGTATARVRELVLRVGDPLAVLSERPFLPTGSRSVAQRVSLGESMTDVPFAVPFAGVHVRIVAATGGGKSKWILRSVIDGLSACRDCVLGGIDITNGPEFALWRGVIQHRGLNVADAEQVLDGALAEIDRRGKILTAIAEDDDPDNDVDEWHADLGPAYVVLVDEFAQLAVYDGKGGRPDLLGKCEQVVRTGRKHWVSLVMLTQRTGNDDFGSTTMSTQCGVSIAGPCDPADAVRMFGVERRDAGYTPHLLSPGVEGDIRDAGKVFLDSSMHRTPDIYRAYAPGTTAEVKRRARQRMDDGLPSLHGRPDVVDAVEVPDLLALVERAFATNGNPERLSTAAVLDFLGEDWTAKSLAMALALYDIKPGEYRPRPGAEKVRGYALAAVRAAVTEL